MVHPRPLRHKLILGLVAMVGSIGLLLGGTLYGARAYNATVRINENKLYELQIANIIVESLRVPDTVITAPEYEKSIQLARESLEKFRQANEKSVAQDSGPDHGEQVFGLIFQLDDGLKQLHTLIEVTPTTTDEYAAHFSRRPEVQKAYETAHQCAEHLRLAIYDDIQMRIHHSSQTIRQSVRVVYFATALSLTLMVTLLYTFCATWVFWGDGNIASSSPNPDVAG